MDNNKPFEEPDICRLGELGIGREMTIEEWLAIYDDAKTTTIDPKKDYSALNKIFNSNSVLVDLNI